MSQMEAERSIQIVPGDAGKDRLFAAVIDNVIIFIASLATAAAIPNHYIVGRGIAIGLVCVGYFFLFEALLSSTPGKIVFGLWVRREQGGPCTWRQAAIRTLMRIIEVNPLLIGALPAGISILATSQHQRIGDLLAGTVVRKGREV